MKGALGLVALSMVIWVFWMSWEWLRNRDKNKNNNKSNNN
tara:strand:+ start:176 stop:295 length:120 start_codon:yes stop_codon:yes gene_type:complete